MAADRPFDAAFERTSDLRSPKGAMSDDDDEPSRELHREVEVINQGLYDKFQVAASSVAQLYKDRTHGASAWTPFQHAAGGVTALYQDGVDALRRGTEVGFSLGQQKRTRELLTWAKRKPRQILREDLIAFMCGKPEPGHNSSDGRFRPSHKSRIHHDRRPVQSEDSRVNSAVSDDLLHTFQQAVSVATANDVRSSSNPAGGTIESEVNPRHGPGSQNIVGLHDFVKEEFAKHGVKRPATSFADDEIMPSPKQKRQRFS